MAVCDRCGAEVPREARFCATCGAPVADERPTGERKLATVVFADLVGSTALAGSEDPERTRALLERFYDAMAEEIERAGGTVEKFAGDAVMAAFGAPSALKITPSGHCTRRSRCSAGLRSCSRGGLSCVSVSTRAMWSSGKLVREAPSSAATRSTLLLA
jgi:class 3 adenylate cyclase